MVMAPHPADGPAVGRATLRYATATLVGDYIRGCIGLLLTLVPLVILPMHVAVAVAFAAAALLFFVFLLRTVERHRTVFHLDADGLSAAGPLGTRRIDWATLSVLRLRYFATRRDRKNGWMQLNLASAAGRLAIESTLDGFETVAAAAEKAARRRGLTLDDATETNLLSVGTARPATGLAERWGVAPPRDDSTAPDDTDRPGPGGH